MPIVDLNDTGQIAPSRPETNTRRVYRTNKEMGTATLFSKDHQLDNIIQYIKGMKWTVDYFWQFRNMNEDIQQLDINIPATTQRYHRINKLILIVQSGIENTDVKDITGEAVLNAGFMPNNYDVFRATLTGGREAIFSITNVETKKYNLHPAYHISFKLLTFVDNGNENKLYNNLIYKTVKEYVYDKDHLLDYSAPVILQTDYNKKLSLKDKYKDLCHYYFDNFINPLKNVIAPPTRSSIYTDTMLTDFLFSIVDQDDSPDIYKVTRLDPTRVKEAKCTIWDAIIQRDPSMLKRCNKRIGFKFVPYTFDTLRTRQANLLGVSFLASPLEENEDGAKPDYIDISTYKEYFPDREKDDFENLGEVEVYHKHDPMFPLHGCGILTNHKPDDIITRPATPEDIRNPQPEDRYEVVHNPYVEQQGFDTAVIDKFTELNPPLRQIDAIDAITTVSAPMPKMKSKSGKTIPSVYKEDKPKVEIPKVPVPNMDYVVKKEELPPVEIKKEDVQLPDGYIPPIAEPDDMYVLSKNFYYQVLTKCGLLERTLSSYLRGEILDVNMLDRMLEQYHMWSTKDQYYLIPILLVLVKDGIHNTFKSI